MSNSKAPPPGRHAVILVVGRLRQEHQVGGQTEQHSQTISKRANKQKYTPWGHHTPHTRPSVLPRAPFLLTQEVSDLIL